MWETRTNNFVVITPGIDLVHVTPYLFHFLEFQLTQFPCFVLGKIKLAGQKSSCLPFKDRQIWICMSHGCPKDPNKDTTRLN